MSQLPIKREAIKLYAKRAYEYKMEGNIELANKYLHFASVQQNEYERIMRELFTKAMTRAKCPFMREHWYQLARRV